MKKNNETVTKLRTGDEVIVIAGKDIGKKGLDYLGGLSNE